MQRIINKRERIILYITITVVIFSLGFNLLFAPILQKNNTLNKEINLSKEKLKKYLRLLAQKEYLQTKYSELVSGIDLSVKGQDRLVSVLSELENLAKVANIRIIDLRPESSADIDLDKETSIDLRTEGTIEDYLKFIYSIENSLSLLKIKSFQLNVKPNSPVLDGAFFISQELP